MFSPFGTMPANVTAAWHPEPDFRGTYSILSSCLVTMALCVWTAVHLNVPEHKKSFQQTIRKFGYLITGVFAPEVVAWTAYEQYTTARVLGRYVRKALGQPESPSSSQRLRRWLIKMSGAQHYLTQDEEKSLPQLDATRTQNSSRHQWSMIHSLYAVMGGFAFDTSDRENNFLPEERTRVSLTINAVMFLAKHAPELLPNLSEEQIKDKSKAGDFVKILTCLQAIWFCAQCISRLSYGLPICLLELNTFAHALSTMFIYIMWFRKPLDVDEPTLIQGEAMAPLCAAMCMMSDMGSKRRCTHFVPGQQGLAFLCPETTAKFNTRSFGLLEKLAHRPINLHPNQSQASLDEIADPSVAISSSATTVASSNEMPIKMAGPGLLLYMGQSIEGIHFMRETLKTLQLPTSYRRKQIPTVLRLRRPYIEVRPEDVLCWRFATQAFNKYQNLSGFGPECGATPPVSMAGHKYYQRYPDYVEMQCDFMIDRISNRLGGISLLQPNRSRVSAVMGSLGIFGLIFGGIHLTAFTTTFHTQSERLLWIISSAAVMVFVPISYAMLAIIVFIYKVPFIISKVPGLKWLETNTNPLLSVFRVSYAMLIIVAFICVFAIIFCYIILYSLSRVYLVVECFISLAHLPDEIFLLPDWSKYYPHLG